MRSKVTINRDLTSHRTCNTTGRVAIYRDCAPSLLHPIDLRDDSRVLPLQEETRKTWSVVCNGR